jgi:prepilin-type N-terminal cleavage/methylation domain-containing protein
MKSEASKKELNIFKSRDGVTLLELMVSVALFALTMILASGIFQSIIVSQREAIASQEMQENIRYSYEKISKEIRTARRDYTHSCIPSGSVYWVSTDGTAIQFLNLRGLCTCYYLDGTKLMSSDGGCAITPFSPINPFTVLPQRLKTNSLFFKVADSSAKNQAFVTLRMNIENDVKGVANKKIDIQTSLSSRYYEKY